MVVAHFLFHALLVFFIKDVHRRQKLTTVVFQTFWVDYFGCDYLNFEKKEYAYRGFRGVILFGAW